LTVIAKAEALLKRRGIELDTQAIEFDDAPTFEMLSRGESVGVFQLEGQGMRDLMRKMKPTTSTTWWHSSRSTGQDPWIRFQSTSPAKRKGGARVSAPASRTDP